MTIKSKVFCDNPPCLNSSELEDADSFDVRQEGFHDDPDCGWQHFCPSCWPKIEAELEAYELKDDEDYLLELKGKNNDQ